MARHLPESRRDVDTLRARFESLRSILPEERDAADILRQVHALALEFNLTVRGFRPQAATVRHLYAEWPIGLELEGTYHTLGEFLDRLSKFPRIINITDLVIRAKQAPLNDATVDIACTATTFVLLDGTTGATSPPQASPAAASFQTPATSPEDLPTEVQGGHGANYSYRPDGRRDPFVSLVSRGADGRIPRAGGVRPDGLIGVLVNEVVVRGLVQSRGTWIAIVESANGRAYSIRSGDRLMDGTVLTITKDAVVLLQHDTDLSLSRQREVRKYLRPEVH
jgi:hypothetical protein